MVVRYEVGFDPALAEIISEVKYMDQLGFDVPADAKTITLLEDQYVLRVSALKQMLKGFYDVLDQLDASQVRTPVIGDCHGRRTYQCTTFNSTSVKGLSATVNKEIPLLFSCCLFSFHFSFCLSNALDRPSNQFFPSVSLCVC